MEKKKREQFIFAFLFRARLLLAALRGGGSALCTTQGGKLVCGVDIDGCGAGDKTTGVPRISGAKA